MAVIRKIAAAASLLPAVVFAQALPPSPPVKSFVDVQGLLAVVMNWLFGILISLAVIFVVVAAYKYLTAAGDPEKVKSASNTLIYAAIAVAVAILALGIPALISSFLGTTEVIPFR